ncbi:MAG: hypothetical protein Hyperionvirus2_153 [Hyperionvirus sp.]|uniref:Uncharacterized protein n=1 Tax=Hyperionvirus sp. TaxID=2487770 RepID=A0A3G5A6B0_9VIRU|nr:MAG: hypothetical protein Hyperionvirus2_153 [Hyperionvirus sp.]
MATIAAGEEESCASFRFGELVDVMACEKQEGEIYSDRFNPYFMSGGIGIVWIII